MTDCIGVVHAEIKIELLGLIWSSVVCDENQTKQWRDRSYKSGLHWNLNWNVVIDHIGLVYSKTKNRIGGTYMTKCGLSLKPNKTMTWPIVKVWSMPKMKLGYHEQSGQVRSMKKTRQDNDVTKRLGVVYTENNTNLLWPIGPSTDCDEN